MNENFSTDRFLYENASPKETNPLRDFKGIVYRIFNKANNKSYIGISTKSFSKRYHGNNWWKSTHNEFLKRDFETFGEDSFCVEIMEKGYSEEDLINIEELLIKSYNSLHPNGYNMVSRSGVLGVKSEETRRRLSVAAKKRAQTTPNVMQGKTHSDEARAKIRAARLGKKATEEHKQKMRDSAARGKDHPFFGGIPWTKEANEKRQASYVKLMKKVVQIDPKTLLVVKQFPSVKDAAASIGVNSSSISSACLGRKKTVKGFIWKRV